MSKNPKSLCQDLSHGKELGLGFEPFLIEDTVLQESTAGIEMAGGTIDVHTAQGHIEVSLLLA